MSANPGAKGFKISFFPNDCATAPCVSDAKRKVPRISARNCLHDKGI